MAKTTQQNGKGTAVATALLLALLVAGFYWKLTLTNQYTWLSSPDILNQVLPWFEFQAGEWHKGRPALWDPNQWLGQPVAGQGQPGAAYPLNWILFLLPLRDGWMKLFWLHWYFVAIRIMAAWFAYLLARDCGVRRAAALFGGLLFALGGWMGENEWPAMMNGAVWAPLVFLYLLRALKGERIWRSAVLGGFFLGVSWLSGHHQAPMFISMAAGAVWLYMLLRNWKLGGAFTAFWGMTLAAGAMQILPAIEYGRLAVRWVSAPAPVGWQERVPYDVHKVYSLVPLDLVGIVIPGFFRGWNAFLGATALALVVLALALGWRRIETRLFAAVGAGALLYALGHNTVFHGVLYSLIPMIEKARTASMAVLLFNLSGAALAAIGLEELLRAGEQDPWPRRVRSWLLWFAAALMSFMLAAIFVRGWPGVHDNRMGTTALVAALAGLTVEGLRRGNLKQAPTAVCLTALFLIEAGSTTGFWYPSLDERPRLEILHSMSAHSDIASYLRRENRLFRVEVDREQVKYNFGDWYGVQQDSGYLATASANVYHLGLHSPVAKRLFGVEYLVAREPSEFHRQEVFRSVSGLRVFRNAETMPRAFAVHEVLSMPEGGEARSWAERLGEEIATRSFVRGAAPPLEKCEGEDAVWVHEYKPGKVRMRAHMACRGMVVLTDTWFPGWVAKVNGGEKKIWEAYGALRGVVVEKGVHEIEFRYLPRSVFFGAGLSVAALLAALVLGLWRKKAS